MSCPPSDPFSDYARDGDGRYDSKINKSIILAPINFIYSSKRFDGQLM